ncbi:Methyltransferase domain-containing protein [Alicyclobacillus vulcanalis]|uniref:Methyltransferase domain-containing protein n=1 Tax=Alicyclobacillus vulcanalis TaxID=252246 RepID=A0A1N7KK29_9BACL|nr:Methyltransferase domain-containing protein [Alicyclobacillus vulcanalis]
MLDVGCGTGATALLLAERGARVTALDVRQEMIERLRRKAERRAIPVNAVVGSAEHLPWPAASFDAVIGESILVFMDIPIALQETRRVLRRGGFAVFVEMVAPPDPPVGWHEEASRVYGAREVPTLERWLQHFHAAGMRPSVLRAGSIWDLAQQLPAQSPSACMDPAAFMDAEVAQALAEHLAWMTRFGDTLGYGVFYVEV